MEPPAEPKAQTRNKASDPHVVGDRVRATATAACQYCTKSARSSSGGGSCGSAQARMTQYGTPYVADTDSL